MNSFLTRFSLDPVGNTLAVVVLLLLLAGFIQSLLAFSSDEPPKRRPARWWIAALALAGIGVSFYMAYVEINKVEALCGPVGNCNSVQQSPYATLFGVLPVGVFGIIGYLAILLVWALQTYAPASVRVPAALTLWGMTLFGTLFSAYLTFLEPFVIGATCIWCISSALIMLALLYVETPLMLTLWQAEEEDDLA
jgi:uncharacterized membrane protein